MNFIYQYTLACLLVGILAGCIKAPVPARIDAVSVGEQGDALALDIADVRNLPQDLTAYLDPAKADTPLLSAGSQQLFAARVVENLLAPWRDSWRPRPAAEAFVMLTALQKKTFYGSNRRPITKKEIGALRRLCDVEGYPSLDLRAITLQPSEMRGLPTRRPAFHDFRRAGQGFPFDHLQYSALPGNTPVRIIHRSADGLWLFVESPDLDGWLPAEVVAPVDEELMSTFRNSSWRVMVRDGVAVANDGGQVLTRTGLGSLWPVTGAETVWLAIRGLDGRAVLQAVPLSPAVSEPFPLPLTPRNVAELGNRMLGQPYGWGGMHGDRDCSATLQDLFMPFGLAIGRNSTQQSRAGQVVSLQGLAPAERERRLLEMGRPWMTLVWMQGHVMLYLGPRQGRAALLHSLWAVRTRDGSGREGRHFVGRTLVTTLQPGRELPAVAVPEGDLRTRMKRLVQLGTTPEKR
jgi:cell wall-associated NlpC family hydrolase